MIFVPIWPKNDIRLVEHDFSNFLFFPAKKGVTTTNFAIKGLSYKHDIFFKWIFYRFTSVLFFNVLLPPIILDAAYSLYDRDFLNNLGAIVQFAIIGTLFNVFSIGYILKLFHSYGIMGEFKMKNEDGEEIIHDLSLIQCFIFR